MKRIFAGLAGLLVLAASARADTNNQIVSSSSSAAAVPDERDRQVLETALLHLLADPDFDMARVSTNGTIVVLNVRTPEKTGMIQPAQMRLDIGEQHVIGEDIETDLWRRNGQTNTYDSIAASFGDLKLNEKIVVTNLMGSLRSSRSLRAFEENFPAARAWVEAYLPGYSKDGTHAVVRAWIGPSPHGAMVTVFLEKRADGWFVQWQHLARFV